ncbi:MAG: hypothetical protein JRF15_03830 [Deltaproteobacteria bacterium]|jgi:hypothetical protein|nr:hypothetical protein [Deltaproteobacteria bacterium]
MSFGKTPATFLTRRAKVLGSLAVIASICGCDTSRQEHLIEARAAMADAAYDEAVAAAEAGLRAAVAGSHDALDDATSWGLELVKLEAYARAGHGEEAKAQLAQLAQRHPNRVEASEYFATAHQLRGAGAGTAAIEVLDMGAILFPYEPVIGRMIEESSEGGDPAELELLRSLGYVE